MASSDRISMVIARTALAMSLVAGAFLRLRQLGVPSLWLDELLNYDIATASRSLPFWTWVIGFEAENGPLYFATLLAGRFSSDVEFSMRIVAALAGIVTIAVVYAAATRLHSEMAAAVAAMIVATSPFAVYYSREGRTYSLLMLASSLAVFALASQSARQKTITIWSVSIAAIYTAASAVPLVAAIAVAAASQQLLASDRRDRITRTARALAPAVVAAVLSLLLYVRHARPPVALGTESLSQALIEIVNAFAVTSFEVSAIDWIAIAITLCAIGGAVALLKRSRKNGVASIILVLTPVMLTLATLALIDHWFSVRYVAAAYVPFALLAAIGIVTAAEWLCRKAPWSRLVSTVLSIAVALSLALRVAPAATTEPLQKLNWEAVATSIAAHAREGDAVIATNSWTAESLRFHAKRLSLPLDVIDARENPEVIRKTIAKRAPAFVVSAGFHRDGSARQLVCEGAPLFGSELEELRVAYFPRSAWLASRATPSEIAAAYRAFLAAGAKIEMRNSDHPWLGDGWWSAEGEGEGSFRWIVGRSATAFLPLDPQSGQLRLRMMPVDDPARGESDVEVVVNGFSAGVVKLQSGWNEYELSISRDMIVRDIDVIELLASRAVRPSDSGHSGDGRMLSVAVEQIAWLPAGRSVLVVEPAARVIPQTRDAKGNRLLLNAQTVDGERLFKESADRARELDPNTRERLLLRLGVEAASDRPLRVAGDVWQYVEPLIAEFSCSSDEVFVAETFRILLGREPDRAAVMHFVSRLRNRVKRQEVLKSFVRSEEFARLHFRR